LNNARVPISNPISNRTPKELFIVPIAKLAEALSPPEHEKLRRTLSFSNPAALLYLPERSGQENIRTHVDQTGLGALGRKLLARIRSPRTGHRP
jgi:hypothetical protein